VTVSVRLPNGSSGEPVARIRHRDAPPRRRPRRARPPAGSAGVAFPEGTTWCGRAYGSFRPAMFQAATQINEQTLSFLPRLLVMLVTLIVAGPWLVQTFMEYILQLYGSIPQLIG